MNLQQLRYVVEIAKMGSITKAAKNLYMGQPNLSKSVKELETEIGFTLFRRTAKGVVPTPGGADFLGYARSIIAQMDTLTQRYHKDPSEASVLRCAAPRASYAAEAFGRYSAALPQPLNLSYRETNALSVIADVADGTAEIGVVRFEDAHTEYFEKLFYEKGLAAEELWHYAMVVLVHETHPLAALPEVPYHLLAQYTEIVHGDFMPVLPEEIVEQTSPQNQIAIFDRGSQFDILRTVRGSYLWVSPMPFAVLERHGLVQKMCRSKTRYHDVIVHRASAPLPAIAADFAAALREEIAGLIQT